MEPTPPAQAAFAATLLFAFLAAIVTVTGAVVGLAGALGW
jgi:hypothetical protein